MDNKRGQLAIGLVLVAFLAIAMYFLFNFVASSISLSVPQFSPDEANVCSDYYIFGECLGNMLYFTLLIFNIALIVILVFLLFGYSKNYKGRKRAKK